MSEYMQNEHFYSRAAGQNTKKDKTVASYKTRGEIGYGDSVEDLQFQKAIGRKDMNKQTMSSVKKLKFLSE